MAERCAMVVDAVQCERDCAFEARTCERRQGTEGRERARLGDDQALIVDLTGSRLRHSSAVEAELGGPVDAVPGAHLLLPGGFVKLRLTFPPDTRQADVALTHRPEGDGPCFLTLTAGAGTVLGRYAPPRGRLRVEVFDLTKHLPPTDPTLPVQLEVVLYNNAAAGSVAPYRLEQIQIFYKALVRPDPVEP
ncbi:MAG: hypothetical protein R3F43_22005 [bacterium]